MERDDPDFLNKRAEEELDLAQKSTDPSVVSAHYRLASLYLDRLGGVDQRDSLPISDNKRGWKL